MPHRAHRSLVTTAAALTAFAISLPSYAGPNGGTAVGGTAAIQGAGNGPASINQSSQNAIINGNTFNTGAGEGTTFNQPNSSAMALIRMTGGLGPSRIFGALTANGKVFIDKGNDVAAGSGTVVNTVGFLASTGDLHTEDSMAGKDNFNISGLPDASMLNLGDITATGGGFAGLVAPGVRNAGTISATLGTVGLAAGDAFTLDFYGDRLITIAINEQIASAVKDVQTGQTLKSMVGNSGRLSPNVGRVELTATAARAVVDSVINNTGLIDANVVGTKDGMIVLSGATGAGKPASAGKSASAPGQTKAKPTHDLPLQAETHGRGRLADSSELASPTASDVVDTQMLNQPSGTGAGGLPRQFGSRFFIPPPLGETRFIKDEAVLQIPPGVRPAQVQILMSSLGLSIIGSQRLGLLGVTSYRVRIVNGSSVASVIQTLAAYPIVAGAQANYTYRLVQQRARDLGHDPDLAGRQQEGDAAQYALGKLGVIDIHHQFKGTNVTVAVIDSQIDVRHPDLDGVIADQFDAVGKAEPPHPHGTGMAGAIAAHRRLMGIAPAARLYAIHAFSGTPTTGTESTTFNILLGLDWAANKGVRVINMSFAGPRDPSAERALKSAHDKGIVLIAAAGNAGPKSPPLYPGAYRSVIAVTATDANDKVFTGANRGRHIAVAAPGVDILVPAPNNAIQLTTGTSVASAEVSGVVALLLERNPKLKPEDVRKILTSTATRLAGADRDDNYGSGLVDPSKAIQSAGELTLVENASALPQSGSMLMAMPNSVNTPSAYAAPAKWPP
jgi:filamentous hemagglutinin family protein